MAMSKTDNAHHVNGCSKGGLYSAILPLILFAGLCIVWPEVIRGHVYQVQWPWMPSLDLYLRFRLDALSLLFCLIICGTGFFVTLFASSYMAGHAHIGRFFFFCMPS